MLPYYDNYNMIFSRIILVFLILLSSLLGIAQTDILFSKYNKSPLLVNPANTGLFPGFLRANVNYKTQWAGISENLKSVALTSDILISKKKKDNDFIGLGIIFTQAKLGQNNLQNSNFALSSSYSKNITPNSYVSLGVQFGFCTKTISSDGMFWDNQWQMKGFNTNLSSGEHVLSESILFLDLSAGINYFYTSRTEDLKASIGASRYHINKPKFTFLGEKKDIYTKNVLNGYLYYKLNRSNLAIKPSGIFVIQGPNNTKTLGLDIIYIFKNATRSTGFINEMSVSVGIYNRFEESFYPSIDFSIAGFTFGGCYNITTNNLSLSPESSNSTEFYLRYIMGYKKGSKRQSINKKFL